MESHGEPAGAVYRLIDPPIGTDPDDIAAELTKYGCDVLSVAYPPHPLFPSLADCSKMVVRVKEGGPHDPHRRGGA